MSNTKPISKSPLHSQQHFQTYLHNSSPLASYKSLHRQNKLKSNYKNNFSTKMDIINGSSQHKDQTSFSQLKASSIIYTIPQFSTPEVNFEVSECIQKKVQNIKNDIIDHFPKIKSSNFQSKLPTEVHFRHRTSILELQEWLKIKLKNPPLTYEHSLQYKNMIMGIGMKQLIRVIRKRCHEQGQLANQIWELTWSICREIIIYLSKRAHQCQVILQEELSFIKVHQQDKMQQLLSSYKQMKDKLKHAQDSFQTELASHNQTKNKYKIIKEEKKKLISQCQDYGTEYIRVLEENLKLNLKDGEKDKRQWVKKIYRQINKSKYNNKANLKEGAQQALANLIKTNVFLNQTDSKQINFEYVENQANQSQEQNQSHQQKQIKILQEQFLNVDQSTQTLNVQKYQKGQNTIQICMIDKETFYDKNQFVEQIGINTQDLKVNKKHKVSEKQNLISARKIQKENKQKKVQQNHFDQRFDLINQKILNIKKQKPRRNSIQRNLSTIVQGQKILCSNCAALINNDKKYQKVIKHSVSSFYQSNLLINQKRQNIIQKQNIYEKLSQQKYQNNKRDQMAINKELQLENNLSVHHYIQDQSKQQSDIEEQILKQQVNNKKKRAIRHSQYINLEKIHKNIQFLSKSRLQRKNKQRKSSYVNDVNYKKLVQQHQKSKFQQKQQSQNQISSQKSIQYSCKCDYLNTITQLILKHNPNIKHYSSLHNHNIDDSLQQYFDIVNQISTIPCPSYTEKHMSSIIEKNIYPILSQLLKSIKKIKSNQNIYQILQTFPSLPSILMNKFIRKYGVKQLAHKNIKIFLHCLRELRKMTNKFEIIEFLMFTDCKKSTSQDLFVYLLLVGILDQHFINNILDVDEINFLKKVVELFLSNNPLIFEKLNIAIENNDHQSLRFSSVIAQIIMSYRIEKIKKIQQLGFLFIILKNSKQDILYYKKFAYFITSLQLPIQLELLILKKFVQSCSYKGISQQLYLNESSFTTFLIGCQQLTLNLLKNHIQQKYNDQQIKQYFKNNPSIQQIKKQNNYNYRIVEALQREDQQWGTLIKSDKKVLFLDYLRILSFQQKVNQLLGIIHNFSIRNTKLFTTKSKQFVIYQKQIFKSQVQNQFIK